MSYPCEGLPDGPCPENRHDGSVKYGIYDLFLCPSCEASRDAHRPAQRSCTETAAANEPSSRKGKQAKHSAKGGMTIKSGNDSGAVNSRTRTGVSASQTDKSDATAPLDLVSDVKRTGDGLSSSTDGGGVDYVVNELLSYVNFYRNGSSCIPLQRTVVAFYTQTDISEAKKVLIQKVQGMLDPSCSLLSERRNSSTRLACEAEVEDIIGILDAIDLQGERSKVAFVAAKLDALPKFGPEELNVAAVVEKQVHLEATVQSISETVRQLAASGPAADTANESSIAAHSVIQSMVADIQSKFDAFTSSVDARLNHLSTVCGNSNSSNNSANSSATRTQSAQPTNDVDRRLNIVLFGVPEDRDAMVWRRKVDDILQYVSDRPVDVVDGFRLGRYDSAKTRPVLIRLRNEWDKRIILMRCGKLKEFSLHGVFIAADEPIEVRRKQMLERLKYRATRAGNRVEVRNDVLYINDVAEFSLVNGFLNNTRHGV